MIGSQKPRMKHGFDTEEDNYFLFFSVLNPCFIRG